MTGDKGRKSRSGDDMLDWFTISYRTIYLVAGALIVLLAGGGYYYLTRGTPKPNAEATPAPELATTARFTSLEGNIRYKAVGTFEWVTADKSVVLKRKDLVKTGSGSTAEITFFDGTVVHVRPESLITIEETFENATTKERRVAWHISSGEVTFNAPVRTTQGTTEITTPLTRVSTNREAEGAIGVKESGESDIRLFSGQAKVQMTKTNEEIVLDSKETVKVDSDGRAGAKQALPAAPSLISPTDQMEMTYADLSRAVVPLVWKEVPGAAGYHLVVDFSPTFKNPLVDRKSIHETTQPLTGLEAGKYYWRVAAMDRDNNESAFSEFARFTVTKPSRGSAAPPPLVIQAFELRENSLQIKGKTEPGATVSVNGHLLELQPDGSFNEYVTLEKAGPQTVVVRAVGINGGVFEHKRQVDVTF